RGCESAKTVVSQQFIDDSRSAPMPTECTPDFFGFEPVEGREVVAAFDAGSITSDAGALLLGATDRAIKMTDRFASCFHDVRRQELIEHEVVTLVRQRVFGIALGYEDINDHDELRHDPLMAVLAGKLEARRDDCAPVAGKSTLNRLELSKLEPTRYHKISHNPVAIKRLPVDLFLEAHVRPPKQIDWKSLYRYRIVTDLVVARRLQLAQLQPVERRLPGDRRAIVAPRLELACQHRHQRIMAQFVVVIDILIAKGDPEHPLANECHDLV